jgi:hypothetical protein
MSLSPNWACRDLKATVVITPAVRAGIADADVTTILGVPKFVWFAILKLGLELITAQYPRTCARDSNAS